MCADLNLPLLGKVPLDPRIARSCDEGRSFLNEVPDSPAAKVYQSIVQSGFPSCAYASFFLLSAVLHTYLIVGFVMFLLDGYPRKDTFWFLAKSFLNLMTM